MKEVEGFLTITINNSHIKHAYELLEKYEKILIDEYFDYNLEYFKLNNQDQQTEDEIGMYLKEDKKYKTIEFTVYYLASENIFNKWKALIENDFKILKNQKSEKGISMKVFSFDDILKNMNKGL